MVPPCPHHRFDARLVLSLSLRQLASHSVALLPKGERIMFRLGSAIMLALCTVMSMPAIAADKADEQSIKVEIKGTLAADVVAIGGETTGTTITVTFEGGSKVTWELDLGDNKELKEQAKKLDKKSVIVTGNYMKKKGIEVGERNIVKVASLKAADGK